MSIWRTAGASLIGAAIFFSSVAASPARADVMFRNFVSRAFKVSVELPSGATVTRDLGARDDQNGSYIGSLLLAEDTIPDSARKVNISIVDDMGAKVWSGSVTNDRSLVIYQDASGHITVAPAAWAVDAGQQKPQGVAMINFTGKPLSLDFFAQNNTVGKKGIPLGAGVDFHAPVRLPVGDSTFYVHFHEAGGQEIGPRFPEAVFVGTTYGAYIGGDHLVHITPLGPMNPPHPRR